MTRAPYARDATPDPYSPGDVVQFKSGGPLMTVERFTPANPDGDDRDRVRVWWTNNGELQDAILPVTLVRLALEPAPVGKYTVDATSAEAKQSFRGPIQNHYVHVVVDGQTFTKRVDSELSAKTLAARLAPKAATP